MKRPHGRVFNLATAVSVLLLLPCACCLLIGVTVLYFQTGGGHDFSPSTLFGEKLLGIKVVRDCGVVLLIQVRPMPPPFPAMPYLGVRVWVVALFLLILPAIKYGHLLWPEEPQAGLCPSCGYDIRATPDRCPECGRLPPVKGAT